MTPENFTYWLQGFFELKEEGEGITLKQALIIQDHLALVFDKVTPDRTEEDILRPEDNDEISRIFKDWIENNKKTKPLEWPYVDPISPTIPDTNHPDFFGPKIICSNIPLEDHGSLSERLSKVTGYPNWKVDPTMFFPDKDDKAS